MVFYNALFIQHCAAAAAIHKFAILPVMMETILMMHEESTINSIIHGCSWMVALIYLCRAPTYIHICLE